jgi:Domain of unknown function (DUF1996)/Domain of unknown function (DUF4124)
MMKFNKTTLLLAVLAAITTFVSVNADAQIYKWRDQRGIIQYSDKPPAAALSNIVQATRAEIINALQKKDVCTLASPSAIAPTNTQYAGTLFGLNFAKIKKAPVATIAPKPTSLSASISNAAKSANAQYTPFGGVLRTTFNNGQKNVTVFGIPLNPFQTKQAANAGTKSSPVMLAANTTVTIPNTTTANNVSGTAALPKSLTPTASNGAAAAVVANATPNPSTTPATTPKPSNNIVQVGLMPAVDISKVPAGITGSAVAQLKSGVHDGIHLENNGAFRINCEYSHMSNDDPIVYPNQQGAAHHHTFFGNTGLNYASTTESILATGNSTCDGGILNRTGYWMPSIIDTATNTPIKPWRVIVYYKAWGTSGTVKVPPKGLRMITGNAKAVTETDAKGSYVCFNMPGEVMATGGKSIQACNKNGFIRYKIEFPSCWDGVNLDSPDHKSHMAFAADNFQRADGSWYHTTNNCPITHPVAVPVITLAADFTATTDAGTINWRLASDNYSAALPRGLSAHADWMNGWNEATLKTAVDNCLNKNIDCGVDYLGNGTTLF